MKLNKRDRVSKLFIDIAKEMILKEGIQSVSVRKIADEAGYSYATIYNYFDDLSALLWAVKKDMIQDLIEWMKDINISDLDGIKNVFHRYIEYYITYPNVFKFFYFYTLDVSIEEIENEFNFNQLWNSTFSVIMVEYQLTIKDIEVISKSIGQDQGAIGVEYVRSRLQADISKSELQLAGERDKLRKEGHNVGRKPGMHL